MVHSSRRWSSYLIVPVAVGILFYQQIALWNIRRENESVHETLSSLNAATEKFETYNNQLEALSLHLKAEAEFQKKMALTSAQHFQNLESLFEKSAKVYDPPHSPIIRQLMCYNNLFTAVLSTCSIAPQTTARFRRMYISVCVERWRNENAGSLATSEEVSTYECQK